MFIDIECKNCGWIQCANCINYVESEIKNNDRRYFCFRCKSPVTKDTYIKAKKIPIGSTIQEIIISPEMYDYFLEEVIIESFEK